MCRQQQHGFDPLTDAQWRDGHQVGYHIGRLVQRSRKTSAISVYGTLAVDMVVRDATARGVYADTGVGDALADVGGHRLLVGSPMSTSPAALPSTTCN